MRFIELFCGIGGFRLGLEKANKQIGKVWGQVKHRQARMGFNCVWGNDNDKYACQIYRNHFGEIYEGDIRAVDASAIPDHDLLCAGFPCQSFSIAGKRRGFEDTRGTLFFEICRVIRAKRPRYLLLENVKGLLSHDDGSTFETILRALDELGYDCQWQVLNSKDYGVPQNRERVFIVGHTRGQPRPKVFPIGEAVKANRPLEITTKPTIGAIEARGAGEYHAGMQLIEEEDMKIRRLTPLECERLQGFPDNWTEGISDTQRYKCLGNAVTVNVIEAIGKQWK